MSDARTEAVVKAVNAMEWSQLEFGIAPKLAEIAAVALAVADQFGVDAMLAEMKGVIGWVDQSTDVPFVVDISTPDRTYIGKGTTLTAAISDACEKAKKEADDE